MFKNNNLKILIISSLAIFSTSVIAMTDAEIDKLFDQALEESDNGDVQRAISLFENILNARPDMHRVQLELALANFRALNYASAKQLANEILSKPTTPESVKATIVEFLEQVDQSSRPHDFSASVSVGYIYDDNINVGPNDSTIPVGNGTLTVSGNNQPSEASGIQFIGVVGHRYLIPKTFNIAGSRVAGTWNSQASLFRNNYFDGTNDFDVTVGTLRTGPVLLAARKWQAQVDLQYDLIAIGDDKLGYYLGLTPSYTRFISNNTAVTGSLQVQTRDFEPGFDDNRDSLYKALGLNLVHRYQHTLRPTVRLGASFYDEDADNARRSNDGFQISAGLSIEPDDKSLVYANYFYTDVEYEGVEPVFGIARDEEEHRINLGGNYRVETATPLTDFLVNFNYTYTDRKANIALFEYDRSQAVLSLSKNF